MPTETTYDFNATLGYPGEGPPPLGSLIVGCHNEAGLKSNDRARECITEFIQSQYNVLLLQEHKLDRNMAEDAVNFCEARGIHATFSVRKDEAAREGTAVLIKLQPLGIHADDITARTSANSKCTVHTYTHPPVAANSQ